jgi:hypothetical protein
MLMRLMQYVRGLLSALIFGIRPSHDAFRDELVLARDRYHASRQRLASTLGELLDNLEYDRIVHNDGVIPLDRRRGRGTNG